MSFFIKLQERRRDLLQQHQIMIYEDMRLEMLQQHKKERNGIKKLGERKITRNDFFRSLFSFFLYFL